MDHVCAKCISNTILCGVGLMARVVGLGSQSPEFNSCLAVGIIPGGVDSACHSSEVGKMSASMLVSCVNVEFGVCMCVG